MLWDARGELVNLRKHQTVTIFGDSSDLGRPSNSCIITNTHTLRCILPMTHFRTRGRGECPQTEVSQKLQSETHTSRQQESEGARANGQKSAASRSLAHIPTRPTPPGSAPPKSRLLCHIPPVRYSSSAGVPRGAHMLVGTAVMSSEPTPPAVPLHSRHRQASAPRLRRQDGHELN